MQEIYDYIAEYVRLSYVVRRLNAKINNLPEFMYASSVYCNYRSLGLSEDIVAKLEGNASLSELKECFDYLSVKVDAMSAEIYGTIFALSPELKYDLYDYLLVKSYSLTEEADSILNAYMRTVGEIEQAVKAENNAKLRELSGIAKIQYSINYELDSFKNAYTFLGCYLGGMIGRKFTEDIKPEAGLGL